MKKQYTKRQISEALSAWKKQLKTGKSKYTARQIKEAVSYWTKRLDEAVKYDQLVDFMSKNKWTKEDALKNIEKIADEFDMDASAQRDYIEKMINSVDSKDAKGGDAKGDGDRRAEAVVPEKTEKAIAADVMDDNKDAPLNEAAKKPVGKINILGMFYRIHVNARNNAKKAVLKFLNSKKVPIKDTGITFINSFADDEASRFEFKEGEPMVITFEVDVDRASVNGFRKFMAVMLKESAEKNGEEIDEGLFGTLASAFGAAKDKAKAKAAESIKKANEELKEKIGVNGLQEYVKRFCGPNAAKRINHKAIFDGMTESNGELVYRYSVAYTVEQG